jgi:hypothetical protein
MKFENRISRLKAFKGATPPIATYCTVAIVFYLLVFYSILQVDMAAESTTDIFIACK